MDSEKYRHKIKIFTTDKEQVEKFKKEIYLYDIPSYSVVHFLYYSIIEGLTRTSYIILRNSIKPNRNSSWS